VENNDVWIPENLAFYLSVYYSNVPDWERQLSKLRNKNYGKDKTRQHLGFTIIGSKEKHVRPTDPPEALLFACYKFDGFDEQDWSSILENTYSEDQIIQENRQKLLSLGSITPVEHHSRSRQGLKWLYEEASKDETISDTDKTFIENRMKSLLLIYGPTAICSMFQRVELRSQFLPNVPNWRTGYFVERFLYEFFTLDQLQQMKQLDIERAPNELIKYFISGPEQKQES
jgi:hypothetical protein